MVAARREPAGDSVDALRREIDGLRAQLTEARAHQRRLARLAGFAPLSADSVHATGNMLFTLGIALHLIEERVRQSRVGRIRDVAVLLREHAHDLPAFFAGDPRAAEIGPYLLALAEQLDASNAALLDDCTAGTRAIEQLRALVTLQARLLPGGPEIVAATLAELVDEAVGFVIRPKDGILIERNFAPLPRARFDRRLVLLVAFNLIGNARHALRALPVESRRLLLSSHAGNDNQQVLAVGDSGGGFDQQTGRRLGEFGYSTRRGGLGVGLYASMMALDEAGGGLTWSSPGPGLGATFTASIPCEAEPAA